MANGRMSRADAYVLEMAALLHDIGKIGVPDAILLSPDR
jgi:response regulator RpfG family c-di-GMP phosphodiesterase